MSLRDEFTEILDAIKWAKESMPDLASIEIGGCKVVFRNERSARDATQSAEEIARALSLDANKESQKFVSEGRYKGVAEEDLFSAVGAPQE